MQRKYILAFVPKLGGVQKHIIDYAFEHVGVSDKYMLGEASLPHVTLHQFYLEEQLVDNFIKKISLSSLTKMIGLSFNDISCISFDNVTFWASLMPDERSELILLHKGYAELLGLSIKLNFDPHMTLFNSIDSAYTLLVDEVKLRYRKITAEFALSLGVCDEIGQFNKSIHIFDK